MKEVNIYTDGSCSGNPGPGGWCCILTYGQAEKKISGGARETTNNRMELQAVIEGIKALKEKCAVKVYLDSKYVADPFLKKWIYAWHKAGWIKTQGEPVKNADLWKTLFELSLIHEVTFEYIKGHSGHKYNEECDKEAKKQAELFK